MTPPIKRDALTATGYASVITWAWVIYGFGAVLPLLRAEEGISRTVTGLHSASLAGGALIAGVAAVPIVRRLRRRGALRLGLILAVLGVGLLCAGRNPAVTLFAALLAGTGGAISTNTVVSALTEHHSGAPAAILSEVNAVAAGVALLSPLAIGLAVGAGLSWRPAVLLMALLAAAALALINTVPPNTVALDAELPSRHAPRVPLPASVRLLALILLLCVGVEFCSTAWSADLLHQRTGLSAAASSAGLTAVVAGIALGRVVIGRLARSRPARHLLGFALACTGIGWALTWLSTAPAPALAGLFVTGLGIAGQYPLTVALVMAASPAQADQASGVISFTIGLSAGFFPFVLGAVADRSSTHTAFLIVPLLLALAAILLVPVARSTARAGSVDRVPDDLRFR